MNGRSTVSLLALVTLAAAGFAGCLDAPSFLTDTDAEITASENRDLADNAAAAWNPAAVLVGVTAFEASEPHAAMSQGKLPADPTVGNGRALLWLYAYQAEKETRVFRVDADGRIQVENTSMIPADSIPDAEPAGAWAVDSDAAMSTARADGVFAAAASAPNASVVSALATHEGATKWALVAVSEPDVILALVDAKEGKLLLVERVDVGSYMPVIPDYASGYAEAMPIDVHLEGSGSLDASEPEAEFPFSYAGKDGVGVLEIQAASRAPGESLWWAILDSEGEEVHSGYLGGVVQVGPMNYRHQSVEFGLDEPGDYTLVLGYWSFTPLSTPLSGVDYEFVLHVGEHMPEHEDKDDD